MKIRNGNTKKATTTPSLYPQGKFKDKNCRWCGTEFAPVAPSHLYCSDQCSDDANTDKYYKKQYNSSLAEVRDLFTVQEGVCAICQTEGFKMKGVHQSGLNLDHCHKTGKVRGLLCHNCNRALGLLQDNPEYLSRAKQYLEGATTIRKEYTQAGGSAQPPKEDDIV